MSGWFSMGTYFQGSIELSSLTVNVLVISSEFSISYFFYLGSTSHNGSFSLFTSVLIMYKPPDTSASADYILSSNNYILSDAGLSYES